MRLLWLTPEVPEPAGSGGSIRAFHLVSGLATRGWDVTVASVAYPEQAERVQPLADLGVELRLAPRPASQPREAAEALLRAPGLAVAALRDPWLGLQAGVFWTRLAPLVARRLAERPVDAVLLEHDFVASWVGSLPVGLPRGLALQNAGWQMHAADAGVLDRFDDARFRRYARRWLPRFDWACAVSEADAAAATALGAPRPVVVGNGVDFERVADVPADRAEPDALLFTGTMSYPPNAEAAVWMANDVLPRLRELRPATTLRIIGRNPPPAVARLAEGPGVTVTGWVDDLAPELARAAVVVAPLRSGGGTKLKVLEALAAGRPVVATTVGAEGIDVRDGEHLLVADSVDAFVAATDRLLADRELAGRLGAAGRLRMQDRYAWDSLAGRLEGSLQDWLRPR